MRRINITLKKENNRITAFNCQGNEISLSETLISCLGLENRREASFDIVFNEPGYVEKEFSVELYEKIRSGEVEGRCVNKNGDDVVIYETALKDKYPVLARVKSDLSGECVKHYKANGKTPSRNYTYDPLDIMLLVKEEDEVTIEAGGKKRGKDGRYRPKDRPAAEPEQNAGEQTAPVQETVTETAQEPEAETREEQTAPAKPFEVEKEDEKQETANE